MERGLALRQEDGIESWRWKLDVELESLETVRASLGKVTVVGMVFATLTRIAILIYFTNKNSKCTLLGREKLGREELGR